MRTLSTAAALTLIGSALLAAPASAQESDTATATIDRPNRTPVVTDDSAVARDGAAVSVDLFANDADPDGDALELVGGTSAGHGTVRFDGSVATYTPDADFRGEDSFVYVVSDGRGANAAGTVRIAVTSTAGVAPAVVAAPAAPRPWTGRPAAPVTAPAVAPVAAPVVAPAAPHAVRPAAAAPAPVVVVVPRAVAAAQMGPATTPYVAPVAPVARQAARPAVLPFTGPREAVLPIGVGLLLGGAVLVAAGRRRPA